MPLEPTVIGSLPGQRYGQLRDDETGLLDDVVSYIGDTIIGVIPGRGEQTVREASSSGPVATTVGSDEPDPAGQIGTVPSDDFRTRDPVYPSAVTEEMLGEGDAA